MNLGWKLAAVLARWGGPRLLESYAPERRRIAQQTIDSAATNLRASGVDLARTPDALQASKAEEFYSLGLVLGYSYAGSPVLPDGEPEPASDVCHYRPSFHPGARLPHIWLTPDESLYDVLGRGFSLLVPGGEGAAGDAAEFEARCRRRSVPLTVVPVPPCATGAPGQLLLVRPDQHIAWAGHDLAEIDLGLLTGHGPGGADREHTS